MLYRKMPHTGDDLSILGFGCMRLPQAEGKIDEQTAVGMIHSAIDRGVNYLDTAWAYHAGESELLVGKALRGGYGNRVKVATKLPSWLINSRGDMDYFLNAQLKKIGVDHIDYYLIHAINAASWDKLCKLGLPDFIERSKRDGRVVHIGFSFHGLAQDFKYIVDAYPWAFCQIQYNYLDLEYQAGDDGLNYAASKGLGIIVMEPLRGGCLALPAPPAVAAIWNEAKVKRAPAEWALRWLWNRPEITMVLSGMSDQSQVDENISIAADARADTLTAAELELVERAGKTFRELMKVGCTGCGYCMPCPASVNIPECLDIYNKMHLFGAVAEAKFTYALSLSGVVSDNRPAYASQCVNCGECLEKCPQQIKIPDVLQQAATELEGPDLPEREAAVRRIFQKV
jgi:uncharacterized protein